MTKIQLSLAALVVSAVPATTMAQVHGTSCEPTASAFNSVSEGMSYSQAVKILGCEGVVLSSSEMGGYKTVMYGWDGSGTLGANFNMMFQNGNLVVKSQFGLR